MVGQKVGCWTSSSDAEAPFHCYWHFRRKAGNGRTILAVHAPCTAVCRSRREGRCQKASKESATREEARTLE